MKTTAKLLFTAGYLVFASNLLIAQEKPEPETRTFQLTFITPLGTNGVESGKKTNNLSINIIAGYCGGLKGVEVGGFANIIKGNMDGLQLAGYTNVDLGTGRGFQGAGFLNYNHKEFSGAQCAGYANVILSNAKAFQASGFANIVRGNLKGTQFSGFANIVTDSLDGFQGAGFSNYSKGCTYGQASGFANFNFGSLYGPQITGFGNINIGNLRGLQLAGFTNINTNSLHGAQISGFFNYTRKLKGLQLGVFNYVDSLERGTSIGVISFVRNGYHVFEISGNESMYGVLSYKTGTRSFYNILAVGASARNNKVYWGWGYGIGTIVPIKGRLDLNFEATCFQVNEDEWEDNNLNLHNRINALVSIRLTDNLTVFGGPSWNVLVSNIADNQGDGFESAYAPWHIFSKKYDNDVNVLMYPGFSAGIRF